MKLDVIILTLNVQCACPGGYYAKDDTCVDVDECTMNMHGCNATQKCSNLPGGYDCVCDEGKEWVSLPHLIEHVFA